MWLPRAGVLDDEEQRQLRAYAWGPTDALDTTFDASYVISPVCVGTYADVVADVVMDGIYATRASAPPIGTDPRLVPPLTARAALQREDFKVQNGWCDAMTKEVRRVERFKAWELVLFRHYRGMLARYPGRVSIG